MSRVILLNFPARPGTASSPGGMAPEPTQENLDLRGRDGDTLLIAGKGRVWTRMLDKRVVVIGRDPACDVVIDDPVLSRQHVQLRLGPPTTVEDLGSRNGTKVGGKSFRGGGPIAIDPGEGFTIGGFSFLIMAASAHPSTQSSSLERMAIEDPSVDAATSLVKDVAKSGVNVLILGESGVGKEVLAETIHILSGRTGPLQKINCAALSEQLLEAELFGHEKGAFTGAVSARAGLLEAGANGTVFLDEIGEIPMSIQAKLLRAIEAREIVRLGANRPVKIDVRFVCATNRDLGAAVTDRQFRHDLYFRIDGISLRIPPLRERRGMIARLALAFAQAAGQKGGLSPQVLTALEQYTWPGNVRELKAVIERAALLSRGKPISVLHLAFSNTVEKFGSEGSGPVMIRSAASAPVPDLAPTSTPGTDAVLDDLDATERAERAKILEALEACAGNQTRAAAKLGISRTALVTKLRIYRIPRPRS